MLRTVLAGRSAMRCRSGERGDGIGGVDAVGEFEEGVDQAARVVSNGEEDVASFNFGRPEHEGFGDGRRASQLVAGGDDAEVGGSGLRDAIHDAWLEAAAGKGCGQFGGCPARRRCGGDRVGGIEHDGDGARGGAWEAGRRGGG